MTSKEAPHASRLLVAGAITILAFVVALFVGTQDSYGTRLSLPVLLTLCALPAVGAAGLLSGRPTGRFDLLAIFVVAVVIRAVFAIPEPYLSDDVYRYVWDGRVQVAGHSPYGLPPASAELADVESSIEPALRVRSRVNHPEIPTVYPPVTELVFAFNGLVERGTTAIGCGVLFSWRVILLLIDLAIGYLIVRALRRRAVDGRLALLYLWHPLPVTELMWSAHAEAVAIFLMLLAIDRLEVARQNSGTLRSGALWLGLAGAAKLLPFALALLFWRRLRWIGPILVVASAVIVALPYVLLSDERALAGLGTYASSWYFNDMTFHVFGWITGIDVEDKTLASTQWLRRGIVVLFAGVALWSTVRIRDPYRAAFAVMLAFVVLTPTLHPWYLLWLLPFAVVIKSRGGVLLATTVLLSHVQVVQSREVGLWEDTSLWMRCAQFIPPLLVLAWDYHRSRVSTDATSETL